MGDVIPLHKPLLDALPKLPPNGLKSIELFAGGGLMRLGIEWAGITTVWANDFDKHAVRAHEYNFGEGSIVLGDITQIPIESIPDADIIVGGPPCQDYSVAGKGAGEAGERGKLVWRYLEIIERKRPLAFLFENVANLDMKHRPTLEKLITKFSEIGYNVSLPNNGVYSSGKKKGQPKPRILNAWDYGVAQKRERVFIVGIRKDLGITYEFPPSEYETTGYRPVLRDAIGDLPEPNNGTNGHIQTQATTVKPQQNLSNQRGYVADWEKPARTVNTNRLDHAEIHPGPTNHDPKPLSEHVQNKIDNGGYEVYLRKHPIATMDEPCSTVQSQWYKGAPNGLVLIDNYEPQPRRFTVRECLRIQSVPDTYVFPDDMSLSAMYRVVGNGVPSRVAYHLGKALSEQLLAVIDRDSEKEAA